MKRSCDNCRNHVMSQGLFPHYICLVANTNPELTRERIKKNGQDCPYWCRKVRIVGDILNCRR